MVVRLSSLAKAAACDLEAEVGDEARCSALVQVAVEHGVAGWIYTRLTAPGENHTSAERSLSAALRAKLPGLVAAAARQDAAIESVLKSLHAAGVEAVPLKGSALRQRYYPASWQRPMTDVDVLVVCGDVVSAYRALLAAGAQESFPGQRPELMLRDKHPTPPLVNGVAVDLHQRLFSEPRWELPGAVEQYLETAPNTANIVAGKQLTPGALLYHLCLHVWHHRSEGLRLSWLLDVALVLDAEAEPDDTLRWLLSANPTMNDGLQWTLGRAATLCSERVQKALEANNVKATALTDKALGRTASLWRHRLNMLSKRATMLQRLLGNQPTLPQKAAELRRLLRELRGRLEHRYPDNALPVALAKWLLE